MRHSTGVTVGRVGVGSRVDGASGGGRDALVAPSGAQEQDGGDDGDHQDEAGDCDADGEVARGNAQLVVSILLTKKQSRVNR